MSTEALLLFAPACFALNMAPGPNHLLSISNATRHGFWIATVAGIGRLLAFVGMIATAAAGLATVLQTSLLLFCAIKLGGAAYLFCLAFQLWRASPVTDAQADKAAATHSLRSLARQEFLVAAGNPKAILMFTAFPPQFIDLSRPAGPQFALLGPLFLVMAWIAIAAYAYIGSHIRAWLSAPRRRRAFHRICASLLGTAGIGRLAARRSTAGLTTAPG
ncbi:MAG: LysE family translocator [Proteobacteria bacterium]|nr:LysE family translocator [Pseudomonadota bacterium]